MKKFAKIFVCILLLSSVILSLAACGLRDYINDFIHRNDMGGKVEWQESFPFPEGYTGGIHLNYQYHLDYDIKWLETYEEMVDAVTRLRAHGTEIDPIAFFDCEEYGYDLKFCVIYQRYNSEKLSEGQNYFDRKLMNVSVSTYVFFEEVTIDELIYKLVDSYKHINIRYYGTKRMTLVSPDSNTVVNIKKEPVANENDLIRYSVAYGDVSKFYFVASYKFELTEEQIEMFEKTVVVIE